MKLQEITHAASVRCVDTNSAGAIFHGERVLSALLDLRKAGTERTEVDWQQCLTKDCDLTVNVVLITAKSIGKQMGI